MTSNRSTSSMPTRQKVILFIFIVILLIIAWQLKGLFTSSGTSNVITPTSTPTSTPTTTVTTAVRKTNGQQNPQMQIPQSVPLAKPAPMTAKEMALMQLQKETEARYIAALNELQMLKIQKDIAETTKVIATAKLDTVTAQKSTLELLKTPVVPPAVYAQGLNNNPQNMESSRAIQIAPEANYVVISVSQLQGKWGAVVGYQGKLYNVSIGDVLSADGSRVIGIDRRGILLDLHGQRKRVSLVPII